MFLGKQIDRLLERSYQNNLPSYKQALKNILSKDNYDDKDFTTARSDYLDAISESIYCVVEMADARIFARYKLARLNPIITGISGIDHYCAGVEYYWLYYAFTGKQGKTHKAIYHNHLFHSYTEKAINDLEEELNNINKKI